MHEIDYLEFSSRKSQKTITKECSRIADRNGDYKNQIRHIRFYDFIKQNRDSAKNWIEDNDDGWYDNLAVKFKDGKKVLWLVKIEYHC